KRTIQPRPTKASMLRLQKQQGSGLVTAQEAPTKKPETHVSTATSSRSKSTVGATEGVKAFMAQQRARLAKSNTVEQEPKKRQNNFMTGAERYGGKTDRDEASQTNTRKIQVVIKQAKSSGKLNISSRGLTKIPEEVLNM
ncbi:uncharacterized protein B0P05DRAFT_457641, partial [Gilbertella persicaria]|uniref:uncharacterized protein n=1 Tax=Gilbertella persicaria TaxID=101096 RepID=UPI0022201211